MAKSKFKKLIARQIGLIVNKVTGSGLAQAENDADGTRYITPGMPEQVRRLAEEGIVLLKNDNRVLPIREDQTVSVFGRCQHDWFYVGYGSGGDVHAPYEVSFFEGLQKANVRFNEKLKGIYDAWTAQEGNEADHGYWGHWPYYYPEMPLTRELVEEAREESDVALFIIGRAAGEDRENKLEEGCYYLTQTEKDNLHLVTEVFDKTVLIMDCGNIIDMSFVKDYHLDGILYAWQLGQENANALGNVLSGKVSPSGKLSATIAARYEDYPSAGNFGGKDFNNYAEDIYVGYRYFTTFAPEQILFPFGFGLSYTEFRMECEEVKDLQFRVKVTNTGNYAGKEVVQLYVSAPMGKLGKAKRSLVGYEKTKLLAPGESQTVCITPTELDFASFDDSGITGFKDSFVLEAGTYGFYLGLDASEPIFALDVPETRQIQQCHEVCVPKKFFMVLNPLGVEKISVAKNGLMIPAKAATRGTRDLRLRVLNCLPQEIPPVKPTGLTLDDVLTGNATLEEFIAELSDEDLVNLSRGEGAMNSPLGTPGNAGAFGGITKALREKGIPPVITADGPAGLRLKHFTTLLPCGTAIACTWNRELIQETLTLVGQEAQHFAIDVNLAPGLNIQRDPLCGRNFEYYSEDPMLSGRTAAAAVRGLQSGGTSACPKHFACNNQEYNRNQNDSRVSMRALREIYLKNFEYCVKEGKPQNLMTSYNKINGVWSHYNYDLVTTVLREEWGYEGNVVTDWWMRRDAMPEFPAIRDNAYRTRAQVDVLMPGSLSYTTQRFVFDRAHLRSLRTPDGLTRAELQRTAKNVLRFVLTRK